MAQAPTETAAARESARRRRVTRGSLARTIHESVPQSKPNLARRPPLDAPRVLEDPSRQAVSAPGETYPRPRVIVGVRKEAQGALVLGRPPESEDLACRVARRPSIPPTSPARKSSCPPSASASAKWSSVRTWWSSGSWSPSSPGATSCCRGCPDWPRRSWSRPSRSRFASTSPASSSRSTSCRRTSSGQRSSIRRRASSSCARDRSSPTCCSPTRSTAPPPRCRARCSRPCRSARSPWVRAYFRPGRSISGHGHAESHRARGYVSSCPKPSSTASCWCTASTTPSRTRSARSSCATLPSGSRSAARARSPRPSST